MALLFYFFGDRFSPEVKHRNFLYYLQRDTQRSSLSPNTYAIVGLDVGEPERAYMAFRSSAYRDLRPSTDHGGIHAACLGGTWQAAVHGFAGARLARDMPSFTPRLPEAWNRMAFNLTWRGSRFRVAFTRDRFTARLLKGRPLSICVDGQVVELGRREVTVETP